MRYLVLRAKEDPRIDASWLPEHQVDVWTMGTCPETPPGTNAFHVFIVLPAAAKRLRQSVAAETRRVRQFVISELEDGASVLTLALSWSKDRPGAKRRAYPVTTDDAVGVSTPLRDFGELESAGSMLTNLAGYLRRHGVASLIVPRSAGWLPVFPVKQPSVIRRAIYGKSTEMMLSVDPAQLNERAFRFLASLGAYYRDCDAGVAAPWNQGLLFIRNGNEWGRISEDEYHNLTVNFHACVDDLFDAHAFEIHRSADQGVYRQRLRPREAIAVLELFLHVGFSSRCDGTVLPYFDRDGDRYEYSDGKSRTTQANRALSTINGPKDLDLPPLMARKQEGGRRMYCVEPRGRNVALVVPETLLRSPLEGAQDRHEPSRT
jgi:hypothetical protein